MRIGVQISCLVVGTAVCVTAALAAVGYQSARRQYLAGVDRQLTAAAAGLPRVIGDGYFARAVRGGDAVAKPEYDALVGTLNDLADRSGVYYVYAFARDADGRDRDGGNDGGSNGHRIVHLATSASAAERAAGDWAAFREPYQAPPDSLIRTLDDGQTRFAEYTDEFGSFRSIFVRHAAPDGTPFVVGVDVALGEIRGHLAGLVWRSLAAASLVTAVAAVAGVVIARRIARPLRVLADDVDAWSLRDFKRDDRLRADLQRLAQGQGSECGYVAQRFLEVQDRLQGHLAQLTAATGAKPRAEESPGDGKEVREDPAPPGASRG